MFIEKMLLRSIDDAKKRTEKAKQAIVTEHKLKSKTFTIKLAQQVGNAVEEVEAKRKAETEAKARAEAQAKIDKAFESSVRDKNEKGMSDAEWVGGTSLLGDSEDMDQDRATNFLGMMGLPNNSS